MRVRAALAPVLAASALAASALAASALSVAALGCTPKERAATPAPQLAQADVTAGRPAPGGVLEAKDGSALDLAGAFAGKTTILVFYRGFW